MNLISQAVLEDFRQIIAVRLGLRFEDSKMDYLEDILRQRIEANGKIALAEYLTGLAKGTNKREELRALCSQLTVGETYFFRAPEQFRAIAELVVPQWMRRRKSSPVLRMLSAGCASGDEAYSLAIAIREHFPEVPQSDVRIVGADANPSILATAKRARYTDWSLRSTSPEIRDKYFRKDGKTHILDESIRSMVTFEERNLAVKDHTHLDFEEYDIILCRNVIMYLVPEGAQFAVAQLTSVLAPAGFLFLGHAETLRGLSQDFHLRHTHDTFYYQKCEKHDVELVPPPLELAPAIAAMDLSWVDTVRCASEHVECLARDSTDHRTRAQVELHPVTSPKAANLLAPAQFGIALELLRREKFRDALEVLRDLPCKASPDPDVQLLRAVLLTNVGDVPVAETVCQQILSADDLNAGAHYITALCREHAHDTKGAMVHDRTAVYIDPEFAMPHLHLGLLAKRAGDLKTARHELEQASVLLPREDASRILLLGGGFSREALINLSQAQLNASGGPS
ncbi:MAG: CheR family methyltransferase [Terriglobales bacterium]